MNIKRFFGAILTVLGIAGLIYTGQLFLDTTGGNHDIRILIVSGVLGLLFFATGVNLVRATKDEA